MELKFILRTMIPLLIILIFSSHKPILGKKEVKIIYAECGCDNFGSINFDMIKEMGNGPCSKKFNLQQANFYDSLFQYFKQGKLLEDSISHSRGYGTNLEMYIGASKNDSLNFEFGVDYKGYVFYHNKTYFPSKELISYLCSMTKYQYCLCRK